MSPVSPVVQLGIVRHLEAHAHRALYSSTVNEPESAAGLLDAMLGNASEIEPQKVEEEFARILAEGERVERAYKLVRDLMVFTNVRLVLVDKQGMTASKVEYHSIPYRSITHFSVETAGHFDLEAELKIWISSTAAPITKQFGRGLSIYEVQAVLAGYLTR